MAISAGDFRAGMRQLAAAVNVITTRHEGVRAGLTATAVMSLTAEPPQLGLAVNRMNSSLSAFEGSGVFAVNVLSHDQVTLASSFAGANGTKGEDKFATGKWTTLSTGAPILNDCAANFDCRIVQKVDFSTHILLVGAVEATRVAPGTTPLLYMDGAWASLVRTGDAQFQAYDEIIAQISGALDDAIAHEGSARDQLRQFGQAFLHASVDGIDVLRRFHSHETFAPADQLETINARKRDVETKLRALLVRGAQSGEFDIADPTVTTHAIIGMMNSIHRVPHAASNEDHAVTQDGFRRLIEAMVTSRPA